MKRLYKMVSTRRVAGGYEIALDNKPVKTPGKKAIFTPSEKLADAIAAEWAGQGEAIRPDLMRLTQILTTRIDRVKAERPAMQQAVLKYLDTDLLCYRTDHPPEMAEAQGKAWDPWLVWFEQKFGGKLITTTGLTALRQDAGLHAAAAKHVGALDDDRFTVLQIVTSLSGSLVLALAFIEGDITPDETYAAARAEEILKSQIYHEDTYGPDPAQDKKDQAMKADLKAAREYLDFLS